MIKIGEGETAEVFRIAPGKVVKLFRAGFYDEKSFLMEFTTARIVGEHTSVGPKVYSRLELDGRTGYVMEEIQGCLLQDEIDAAPDLLEGYAQLLGDCHRTLHDTAELKRLEGIPNMKRAFVPFFETTQLFSKEVRIWLLGLLASLPDETALLHGDFMPYNMIISAGRLRAIDWAQPIYGPAMADVARTLNFVIDPTDYPDSAYTKSAQAFCSSYLEAYLRGDVLDTDLIHRCLLLNAVSEYSWAMESEQIDDYTKRSRAFILSNFEDYGSDSLLDLM